MHFYDKEVIFGNLVFQAKIAQLGKAWVFSLRLCAITCKILPRGMFRDDDYKYKEGRRKLDDKRDSHNASMQ